MATYLLLHLFIVWGGIEDGEEEKTETDRQRQTDKRLEDVIR